MARESTGSGDAAEKGEGSSEVAGTQERARQHASKISKNHFNPLAKGRSSEMTKEEEASMLAVIPSATRLFQ